MVILLLYIVRLGFFLEVVVSVVCSVVICVWLLIRCI